MEKLRLEENEVVVVGVYSTARDGKTVYTISYLRPFEAWQAERGTVNGLCAETEFTHADCSELHLGDVVRLAYRKGFKGRADLAGFSVIRHVDMKGGN